MTNEQQANPRSLTEVKAALQLLKKGAVFCPPVQLKEASMPVRGIHKARFCHRKQSAYFVMKSESGDHTKWTFCKKSPGLFSQK
jgi:hypothetical protein